MPTIRKIWKQGNSFFITLPFSWLESFANKAGKLPSQVTITDKGSKLEIRPLADKRNKS